LGWGFDDEIPPEWIKAPGFALLAVTALAAALFTATVVQHRATPRPAWDVRAIEVSRPGGPSPHDDEARWTPHSPDTCPWRPASAAGPQPTARNAALDLVDVDDLVAIATRVEALEGRVTALREAIGAPASDKSVEWCAPVMKYGMPQMLKLG
jgi:hypothetical protein